MFDRIFTNAEMYGDVFVAHRFTDSTHNLQFSACKTKVIFQRSLRNLTCIPGRRFPGLVSHDGYFCWLLPKPLDQLIRGYTAHPDLATCNSSNASSQSL